MFHLGDGRLLVKKETLEVLHAAPEGKDYAKGWIVMRGGVLAHGGSIVE